MTMIRTAVLSLVFVALGTLTGCGKEPAPVKPAEAAVSVPTLTPLTSSVRPVAIPVTAVRELPPGCVGYTLPATIETYREQTLVEQFVEEAHAACVRQVSTIRGGHEERALDRLKVVDEKAYFSYMEHMARGKGDDELDKLKTSFPSITEHLKSMEAVEADYGDAMRASHDWKLDMLTVARSRYERDKK